MQFKYYTKLGKIKFQKYAYILKWYLESARKFEYNKEGNDF